MHSEDLYYEHPELQTPEEREENESALCALPDWWTTFAMKQPNPDAEYRRAFEVRGPALGLTAAQLYELEAAIQHPSLLPVQRRLAIRRLGGTMRRQLISTHGASTCGALVAILRDELESGEPSRVPDWYTYSTVTMGPRKIGYTECSARGCFNCETAESTSQRYRCCASCKVPRYCSVACQKADWKARHKVVCKEAAKQREMMARVGNLMQGLSDRSLTSGGGGLGGLANLFGGMDVGSTEAARVAERRAHLESEQTRGGRRQKKKKKKKP